MPLHLRNTLDLNGNFHLARKISFACFLSQSPTVTSRRLFRRYLETLSKPLQSFAGVDHKLSTYWDHMRYLLTCGSLPR